MLGIMPETASAGARPTILLDCDPGHDDAIAIVVAARHTELVGITTVAGNAPLTSTTHNALVMRDLLGIDVPIHSGAARPLVGEPKFAGHVHGQSGLDGADLPNPSTPLDGTDAVNFIIDTCRSTQDLWLVPIGPLTNIALALRTAPDIAHRIAGISLMGGGTFGNRSSTAEFNIWADPEAAHVVFSSGVRIVMAGLDVTHQFTATPDRIAAIRSTGGLLGTTLADLLTFFSAKYGELHDDGALIGGAIHDPLAVMALSHPHLFERVERHVVVETRGEYTRGMTVIDQRKVTERQTPNCDMLTSVDAPAAFDVALEAITHFTG